MHILLVDDQPSIIASLVSCIPWHDLGISSVSTASSARSARMILEKQEIDILITDIEMPGEDGLDLLTWVRDQKIDAECILLTAHADFFYAKRAISLNVSDYIIQPARDEDVIRAVKKAMLNRQANRQRNDMVKYQGQDFEEKNKFAQSVFENWPASTQALTDPEVLSDPLNRLKILGADCSSKDPCILMHSFIRNWHRMPASNTVMMTKLRRVIDNTFGTASPIHVSWVEKNNIINTLILTSLTDENKQLLQNIYQVIDTEIGCRLRTFYAASNLTYLGDAMKVLHSEMEQFSFEHAPEELCFTQVEISGNGFELNPVRERNLLQLEKIKKYIKDNMEEPITRTQIADALFLSPSYVSHIVKELEDLSCKELITKIKMDHARKLLRSSRYSIGDIAVHCGYDSFSYFSKVYKDTFGITPSTERESLGHSK